MKPFLKLIMILCFFGSIGICIFRLFISFAPSQILDSSDICISLKLQSGKKRSKKQKTGLGTLVKKNYRESCMHKIMNLVPFCYFSSSFFSADLLDTLHLLFEGH